MPARRRVARTAALGATVLLAGCVVGPRTTGSGPSEAQPVPSASANATTSAPPSSIHPSMTAAPTPTPDPAVMDLVATTCPGGVVLEWTPSTHPNFHHYTALRSLDEEIAPDYPPIAPAVDWGVYATDPFITSAVDSSILPSSFTWHYRVMAYDILNDPVSTSPVRVAHIEAVDSLGEPEVEGAGDGVTRIGWSALDPDAQAGCFSSYRVLFGSGRPSTVLTEVSDRGQTEIESDALVSGTTYLLRVDAVRVTPLGNLLVGRSRTVVYTVP